VRKISDGRIFEGFFKSPLAIAAPGLLPEEAETARYVINSNVYLLCNFLCHLDLNSFFLRKHHHKIPQFIFNLQGLEIMLVKFRHAKSIFSIHSIIGAGEP